MRTITLSILLALAAITGYGQATVFQWGAVVKANVSVSNNPTNAAKGIKANADGDLFVFGTFSSNNTEQKKFTRILYNHYNAEGTLVSTLSPEGAKVARSAVSNNDNFFLYKLNRQGEILWQVVSDRGYVGLHYSQIVPTHDGGVFAMLDTRLCTADEFEDKRLIRLVGSDNVKKDLKLDSYVTNTQQGVAAKIDRDGKIEWIKHILRVDDGLIDGKNATTATYFNALEIDEDGNYWLGGRYMKAITFDKPDGTTQTLTPHNVEGWDGDSQNSRGDALLVKLNPAGELLWSLETSGTVDYQSINSLQLRGDALYVYGNLAATPGDETSSTTVFGHTLYPSDKTNAWSARIDLSGGQPAADWVTLLKSLPQTNGKGGRIKVTNACFDNGAFFLCGSVTGFIEVNGVSIVSNDATTGESSNPLMGFVVRQDPATGGIIAAHLDPAGGLAAEIENVAFRQNKIYAYGYALGGVWLHVYDADFQAFVAHNLFSAQGATAWDALFFDDRLITINRGRQLLAVSGYITGAPQAFVSDAPDAYSAYFLSYGLEGLQSETAIRNPGQERAPLQIASLPGAVRITGNAQTLRIFNLSGAQLYATQLNGTVTLNLSPGLYIVTANVTAHKILVK